MNKFLLFSCISLFSIHLQSSWQMISQIPSSGNMKFDIQIINQRLEDLKKLKVLHAKEDFLDLHNSELVAKERKFIQEISALDPDTPYQAFVDQCDNSRFFSDDLFNLQKERLKKTQEYYDESSCNSGIYHNVSLENSQKFQKMQKAEQLKKLKKTYQDLQKEVQTYDETLKTTTTRREYTHTTYGYNSRTEHYDMI